MRVLFSNRLTRGAIGQVNGSSSNQPTESRTFTITLPMIGATPVLAQAGEQLTISAPVAREMTSALVILKSDLDQRMLNEIITVNFQDSLATVQFRRQLDRAYNQLIYPRSVMVTHGLNTKNLFVSLIHEPSGVVTQISVQVLNENQIQLTADSPMEGSFLLSIHA